MKKKKIDLYCNIFLLAVGGLIFALIPSQITADKVSDFLGPRFFIYCSASILAFANAVGLIRNLVALRKERLSASSVPESSAAPGTPQNSIMDYGILVIIMALLFLTTFVINFIGYIPTYIALAVAILALFREKKWHFYVISAALVVLIYFLFKNFLFVPLP